MSAPASDPLALPPVPPPADDMHPVRDRVAVVMFALALALPALALVRTAKLDAMRFENRRAAAWPALTDIAIDPRAYTAAFERAFADRFGARDALIRLHHEAKVRLFGVAPVDTVMLGRAGWLYFLGEDGRSLDRHYRGTAAFPDAEIDALALELEARAAWLAARGIAYVVAIVPEKFTIYPEFLPHWVTRMPHTPLDRATDAIALRGKARLVDLRGPLREAKARERVYYLTDSHWNLLGATVGYHEIMRAAQLELARTRPGPSVTIAPPPRPPYVAGQDVWSGDLARLIGFPVRFREPDLAPLAKILGDSSARCARRIDAPAPGAPDTGFETYVCDRPELPRAVVYRDSQAIPLIPLLSENFSRVVYVSSRWFDPALIERERPDLVIEEMVERSIAAPAAFPLRAAR